MKYLLTKNKTFLSLVLLFAVTNTSLAHAETLEAKSLTIEFNVIEENPTTEYLVVEDAYYDDEAEFDLLSAELDVEEAEALELSEQLMFEQAEDALDAELAEEEFVVSVLEEDL